MHDPQGLFGFGDILGLVIRWEHIDQRGVKIASVAGIKAGDDSFSDFFNVVINVQFRQLMEQEVVERLGALHRICHQIVLPIRVFLNATAGPSEIVEGIGHVIAHVFESFEVFGIRGILANDQFSLVFGSGGFCCVIRFKIFIWKIFIPFGHFEHWVFFHLLLDSLLEGLDR